MASENKITFYINHQAYHIDLTGDDGSFEAELKSHLKLDVNIDTKELLAAFVKQSYKVSQYDKQLQELSNKLSQTS
jgi:hypothetical protein